ncbi:MULTISPECIES: hypothetical protein [Bradyrhizobium]|uniref:Uncharacterized protein n=1 Tax=Bradyrhizobium zhengyangense TaxID=2911009 RepID=A0A9X1RKL4_9BRAD|nr:MULTISPECIES: hypothetical protein [Bradyrhizobium]MCG2631915.1 hypothetical protein [Bradyrhizobium zhengyangense]MCG2644970.1 hypothetical protein [Bradyrhizobium zhengyangense]MCG2672710.1 hypothetical protein [Bradyrhizobium zhengyangense]MDN4985443.1 hypothetical protein [Bradyrhizobium sp. WYCCWR 13022]MDN5002325.1 hypothetical protein [Bradyrhizobium sp. WYCCWR 12677]
MLVGDLPSQHHGRSRRLCVLKPLIRRRIGMADSRFIGVEQRVAICEGALFRFRHCDIVDMPTPDDRPSCVPAFPQLRQILGRHDLFIGYQPRVGLSIVLDSPSRIADSRLLALSTAFKIAHRVAMCLHCGFDQDFHGAQTRLVNDRGIHHRHLLPT